MNRLLGCFAFALLVAGCSETGQTEIYYPAFATPTVAPTIEVGTWTVTLDQASVLFGPVYFCAAATGAATLCTAAIAEIRQVSFVDLLNGAQQPLGEVHGFSGTIRSTSYDHGIHWFVTETEPKPETQALNGHSAVFAGQAQRGGQTISFAAYVDVLPSLQGERAVTRVLAPVMVEDENVTLEVKFDVAQWLAGIDFDAAAAAGVKSIVIDPESKAHSGIVSAISNIAPPAFVWAEAGSETP